MITYKGSHECTFFVASEKGKNLCGHQGNRDMELVFDDCIVIMPEQIMHYLDPTEATSHIGWKKPWRPPAWFIDKVLTAKQIRLQPTRKDYATKHVIKMGYLTHGSALKKLDKYKEIENDLDVIVDTQGSDFHYDHANPIKAQFGDSPNAFLSRMFTLVDRADLADRYLRALDAHTRNPASCLQYPLGSLSAYPFPTIVEFDDTAPSAGLGRSFALKPLMLQDRIRSSAQYQAAFLAFDAFGTPDMGQLLKFATYLMMNELSWTAHSHDTFTALVDFNKQCLFTTSKLQRISHEEIIHALCQLLREIGVTRVHPDNTALHACGKVHLMINRNDALRLKAYHANIDISPRPEEVSFVEKSATDIETYFVEPKIAVNPFYCPPKQRPCFSEEKQCESPPMLTSGYQLVEATHVNSSPYQQTALPVPRRITLFAPCTPNEDAGLQKITKPLDTLNATSHAEFCQKLDDFAKNPCYDLGRVSRRHFSAGSNSP